MESLICQRPEIDALLHNSPASIRIPQSLSGNLSLRFKDMSCAVVRLEWCMQC